MEEEVYGDGKLDAIRNPDGIWVNTRVFQESGTHFKKYGYYTPEPWGSPAWEEFWDEEEYRCLYGYTSGGATITGDHYNYLNYSPILRIDNTRAYKKGVKKVKGFPDFWDGDYNYFWIREIAREGVLGAMGMNPLEEKRIFSLPFEERIKIIKEYLSKLHLIFRPLDTDLEGGKDLIVGKARRRGFSNKNASIASSNFFHRPGTLTLMLAYEKKYLFPGIKTIFGKCKSMIDFINDNTGWLMPSDVIDNQSAIRASYISYREGKKIEKGSMAEIEAVSCKDNPDSPRGSDAYDVLGEEVGAWGTPGGLKALLAAIRSSSEAGSYKTGLITFFGTSGDIEKGTADFADLIQRPQANNFMSFYDIWGKRQDKIEGMFFPAHLNKEGYYDEAGNSDLEGAKKWELDKREELTKSGATSQEMKRRQQEEPLDSSEAFSFISSNRFPVQELAQRVEDIKIKGLHKLKGIPVTLIQTGEDTVIAKPILNGTADPIMTYRDLPHDLRGCPVIYEHPIANPPKGLYKIGYDPVKHDFGSSLAAIVVYKSFHKESRTHSKIVAEYVGRPVVPEDADQIALMLSILYNTKVMYENEVPGTKNYFRRKGKLDRLAWQPDKVISKNTRNSKVSRTFGCHMTEALKIAGEKYIVKWLNTVLDYNEHDQPITVIDNIDSLRGLEELILYNREGNFDWVSALIMCLFQVEEESLEKEYSSEETPDDRVKQLMALKELMHGKR